VPGQAWEFLLVSGLPPVSEPLRALAREPAQVRQAPERSVSQQVEQEQGQDQGQEQTVLRVLR
jgi:hypothetical protein